MTRFTEVTLDEPDDTTTRLVNFAWVKTIEARGEEHYLLTFWNETTMLVAATEGLSRMLTDG